MKVAIIGCASDPATALLPLLLQDDSVDVVIGIGAQQPRLTHEKLEHGDLQADGSGLATQLDGVRAVFQLAPEPPVNLFAAAAQAGCDRVISLHSAHLSANHLPIVDPPSQLRLIDLTVPFVAGPDFENPAIETFCRPAMVWPHEPQAIQLLHQDDLARALHGCLTADIEGHFEVAPGEPIEIQKMASIHGQKLRRVAKALVGNAGRAVFRAGWSSASSDWIAAAGARLSGQRFEQATGWSARLTSRETAEIMLLQHGRPILPGELTIKGKGAAEAALALANRLFGEMADEVAGLGDAIGGRAGFDQIIEELEHEWLDWNGTAIHMELHTASQDAPTIIFTCGLGNYTRFWSAAMGAFRRRGINVIGVDRPGHGLSEGLRGDATVEENIEIIGEVVNLARSRFDGPVFLSGASLGGMTTWWALPYKFDIDGAVMSNMVAAGVRSSRADTVKAAALRAMAKIRPRATVPIKRLANFDVVADDESYRHYFGDEPDRIFAWSVTARSALSIASFDPPGDWKSLDVPALVLTGGDDQMIPAELVRDGFERSALPNGSLVVLPGLAHGLFDEHLDQTIDYVERFVLRGERNFGPPPSAAGQPPS